MSTEEQRLKWRLKAKAYREKNLEKQREYARNKYKENPSSKLASAKKYRDANKDRTAAANKLWAENNKERKKATARTYYKTNFISLMFKRAKARATEKNVPFNLTEDDIIIPTFCPLLGIELQISSGSTAPNSPSLDRIIPELGYVKGNVMVISHRANTIKNNATLVELQTIVESCAALVKDGIRFR